MLDIAHHGPEQRSLLGFASLGLVSVLTIAMSSCGLSGSPAASVAPSAVLHGTLSVDGLQRSYRLFRPSLVAGARVALVIVLHDLGATGDDIAERTRYDDQAGKSRFVAVYPDGVDGSWNAGRCCDPAKKQAVDDVKFISLLIDQIVRRQPIDSSRVFVTGFSNGAAMTYRLACELSDRIKAVTSVSGAMIVDNCRPARPVSLQEIHGTKDQAFPYEGCTGGLAIANAFCPSVNDEIQQWVMIDGCTGAPTLGGSGIHKTSTWSGCRSKTMVRVDAVEGGPHTWFANATSASWQFFSASAGSGP
jgi:polyhydroxybutyrate depolymerase